MVVPPGATLGWHQSGTPYTIHIRNTKGQGRVTGYCLLISKIQEKIHRFIYYFKILSYITRNAFHY